MGSCAITIKRPRDRTPKVQSPTLTPPLRSVDRGSRGRRFATRFPNSGPSVSLQRRINCRFFRRFQFLDHTGSNCGCQSTSSAVPERGTLIANASRAEIPCDAVGRRLPASHGVQGPRPDSIRPHPEQSICGEKLNPTLALAPQDGHLMPKGDEFKFQAGTATKAEREQRNESGNHGDHAHHGTAVAQKSLGFLDVSEF